MWQVCLRDGPHSLALASAAKMQMVLWTLKHAVKLTAVAMGRILLIHEAAADVCIVYRLYIHTMITSGAGSDIPDRM